MSQNPLLESAAGSSSTTVLQPLLKAALSSLEIDLTEELTRYRRRRGQQIPLRNEQSISPARAEVLNDLSINNDLPESSFVNNSTQSEFVREDLSQQSVPEKTAEQPLQSAVKTTIQPESTNSAIVHTTQVNTPHVEEGLLHTTPDTHLPPDDYLESSEALLRSLTEEQPESSRPVKSTDRLLSPLGIGSMLLLLLASATLGYVAMNPVKLPFASKPSPDAANPPETGTTPGQQVVPTSIPKAPNLAAREFVDVNLDTIPVLQPKSSISPTPKPLLPTPAKKIVKPTVIQTLPIPQVVPTLPPLTLPPIQSATTPLPKSPIESVTTPPAKPLAKNVLPSSDGYYHVVADNNSDRALTDVRKVVTDAYSSPKGTIIYLGAVKTPEEAEKLIQQLQSKGIKARISQP
jgi:hypothetical protein